MDELLNNNKRLFGKVNYPKTIYHGKLIYTDGTSYFWDDNSIVPKELLKKKKFYIETIKDIANNSTANIPKPTKVINRPSIQERMLPIFLVLAFLIITALLALNIFVGQPLNGLFNN